MTQPTAKYTQHPSVIHIYISLCHIEVSVWHTLAPWPSPLPHTYSVQVPYIYTLYNCTITRPSATYIQRPSVIYIYISLCHIEVSVCDIQISLCHILHLFVSYITSLCVIYRSLCVILHFFASYVTSLVSYTGLFVSCYISLYIISLCVIYRSLSVIYRSLCVVWRSDIYTASHTCAMIQLTCTNTQHPMHVGTYRQPRGRKRERESGRGRVRGKERGR